MSVVADLELTPSLDEVRELAGAYNLVPLRHTFIADCETPVSAFLKLRGGGPSFLLESAEQGQRVGRFSFIGYKPHDVLRFAVSQLVDLGMPAAEVLVTVTSVAAQVCGLGASKGRIATGYDADLLAVEGDLIGDRDTLLRIHIA